MAAAPYGSAATVPIPLIASVDSCINAARCYHDPHRVRADIIDVLSRQGVAALQPKLGPIRKYLNIYLLFIQ